MAECEPGYLGRYLRHELELCHNNFQGDATELKNTIVHELIHAYDECRAKDFDWSNCRHLACSEVRSGAILLLGTAWSCIIGTSALASETPRLLIALALSTSIVLGMLLATEPVHAYLTWPSV